MKREFNTVELELPVCPNKDARVVLNGVPLSDVRRVSLNSGVGDVTEVTITLIAHVNHDPALLAAGSSGTQEE